MLGYVQIHKPELKVREYEIYQGYYCGVCKYIGSTYGQLPRMALSYDAAFLACLLASVGDEPDQPAREHCIAHHINKKTVIRNPAISYAGDVMLILAWYKLKDDAADEGKLSAKAVMKVMKPLHRKLREIYPDLCREIEQNLAALSLLEKANCPSLDQAAESFAKIMEVIFRQGSCILYPEKDNLHETFANIGYHMGKWIYLMDAADDIEDNIETGAYNPLLWRFDWRGRLTGDETLKDETPIQFRKRIYSSLEFNLYHYLAVLGDEMSVLDTRKNKGIIDNIIYFGMNRKTEAVLDQTEKKEEIK